MKTDLITVERSTFLNLIAAAQMAKAYMAHKTSGGDQFALNTRQSLHNALAAAVASESVFTPEEIDWAQQHRCTGQKPTVPSLEKPANAEQNVHDVSQRGSIIWKLDKLGLPAGILEPYRKPSVEEPGQDVVYWEFRDGADRLHYCESLRELEAILDDLIDPGFRRVEAQADARFVDRAYGQQD